MSVNLRQFRIDQDWKSFELFRDRRLDGLGTGIETLDKALLGLGASTVIQGPPGSNKSTLALQVAWHNAKSGSPALIIDKENGFERTRARLLCMANGVSFVDVLVSKGLQLDKLIKTVTDLPIYVPKVALSSQEIDEAIALLCKNFSKPVVLVLDSLHAAAAAEPQLEERQAIGKWMNFIDEMKLKYEGRLYIVVTAEKNYSNFDRATMKGGKGSSAIPYKGEMIVDMIPSKNDSGTVKLTVIKNRDGRCNYSVELKKVLASESNPDSFTFRLSE